MAKSRKSSRKFKKNKFKKGWVATPQHNNQTRLVKMEKRLLPFVKKNENGKIIGVEFPEDNTTNLVNPMCPRCGAPMELKKPKEGDKWQPFWGCTMYSVTRCRGNGKDIIDKKPLEPAKNEDSTIESVVGNQNKINELEIVKKNKQGEFFVNKSIQAESKGSLSWNDVIDLIDEALDENEYPEIIIDQLELFSEQILKKIQTEQGIAVARKAPKKTVLTKEQKKIYTKSARYTYNEIAQNKEYKTETSEARSINGKKRAERQQKSMELLKQLKPKSFGKPKKKNQTSQIVGSSTGPNCPICQGAMIKKEPKAGQTWQSFWGCVNFKTTGCKGSRKAD